MSLIFCTFVVSSDVVESARNLGACLTPSAAGMFTTPLSPSGAIPATHYISSGLIDSDWLSALENGPTLYAAAQKGSAEHGAVLTATSSDAVAVIANCDVSLESADTVMSRLGLKLISGE
jgi:hypothetical protein